MGIGPVPATEAVLARNDLTIDDIGLIEINEAFAVQVLAFLDHFKIADDDPRVNPWGGAIALGQAPHRRSISTRCGARCGAISANRSS
jgi:acetyl-CoA acyltransferase